jgi:hypothetical protein
MALLPVSATPPQQQSEPGRVVIHLNAVASATATRTSTAGLAGGRAVVVANSASTPPSTLDDLARTLVEAAKADDFASAVTALQSFDVARYDKCPVELLEFAQPHLERMPAAERATLQARLLRRDETDRDGFCYFWSGLARVAGAIDLARRSPDDADRQALVKDCVQELLMVLTQDDYMDQSDNFTRAESAILPLMIMGTLIPDAQPGVEFLASARKEIARKDTDARDHLDTGLMRARYTTSFLHRHSAAFGQLMIDIAGMNGG